MGDHSIDVAGNSRGESSSKPCIFEIPALLRRHSPKSFTPNSFSIGPLHYKKEYLKAQIKAEKIKQHYLNNLLTRKPTSQTTREDFKRSILEVEEKARQCYDVPFDHLSKDEFVDMLVIDGCFIIELLLRNSEIITDKNNNNSSSNYRNNNNTRDENDPVFSVSWVLQVLYHDLILLENQIPWFVLARLYDMTSHIVEFQEGLMKFMKVSDSKTGNGNGKHKWRISLYRPSSSSPTVRKPQKNQTPEEFIGTISGSLMADPVIVSSGPGSNPTHTVSGLAWGNNFTFKCKLLTVHHSADLLPSSTRFGVSLIG